MAFGWDDALVLGGSFLAKKLGGRGRRLDVGPIISRYRGEKPTGYLTPEDEAQAERFRLRRAATAGKLASDAEAGVVRRAAARGIGSSPALERDYARITQQRGAAGEEGATAAESYLSGLKRSREDYQQRLLMSAFGAEVGAAQDSLAADRAREGAFWNSVNDYLGQIDFGGGSTGAGLLRQPSTAGIWPRY